MVDNQGEEGIPLETVPLFTEAARQVERKKAANVVLEWLEGKKGDPTKEETTQVALGEMAKAILEKLKQGQIFFGVKKPEELKKAISVGTVTGKIPLENWKDCGVDVQQAVEGIWVVLLVRQGIRLEELEQSSKKKADEALVNLYKLDLAKTLGRITVSDGIKLKDPDIGPFPKLN